jgi:RimJ/RimL family protein N-acetyltransferase
MHESSLPLDPAPVSVTLRNGSEVCIRSVRADDRDRLDRAFRNLDRESVYTRFFRYVMELTDADLKRATEPDPEHEVALVVTLGSGAQETIIAGGRYVASPPSDGERAAEIAFLVEEDFQGLGIAGLVLKRLVEIARGRGITCFEAEVLAGNRSMLRVFSRSGLPIKQRRDGGVVHVQLSLSEPGARAP